jgi:hypothetical protein
LGFSVIIAPSLWCTIHIQQIGNGLRHKPQSLKDANFALRQKRIEVPDRIGPVRWSLAHSFFQAGLHDLEEGSCQEVGEETSAIQAEKALSCELS